jgi:fructose-bisphosphate aldolase class II
MPIIDAIDLYQDAKDKGYAVGAFDTNVGNPDFIMSIIDAAEELDSPVIIQGGAKPLSELYDIRAFGRAIVSLAQDRDARVVLHLNQVTDLDQIRAALDCGFNSIMISTGQMTLKENIEFTKKAVEIAEVYNAAVEGKLGKLGGREDVDDTPQSRTDPEEAVKFVKETGIDVFAPSIGTVYGMHMEKPKLDLDLLSRLQADLDIGMVIHGASGLTTRNYRDLIERGTVKINVSTAMRTAYLKNIRDALKKAPESTLPYEITAMARGEIKKIVMELMRLFKGQWD